MDFQYNTSSFYPKLKSRVSKLLSIWLVKEFLFLTKLAIPNTLAFSLSSLTVVVSVFFTGHISKEDKYLDGSSIALSFANVTGNAVTVGLSTALETLCSQAYGAKQYRRSGLYLQRGLLIHALICFPLVAVWLNTEHLLLLLHQEPEVAKVAGQFLSIYALALPAMQISYLSLKLFQSHNLIFPQIPISLCSLLFNVMAQYLLVVYMKFGISGSAVALTASQYVMALGFTLYTRFSHLYKQTWGSWRFEALLDWHHYLKYGIPGMLMTCFEWSSFESGYFSVGALAPYPKVELGIYSVLMNFAIVVYSAPLGFMIAGTVRVGNLLGSNEPSNAKGSCYFVLTLMLTLACIQFTILFSVRQWFALLFTDDACIIAGSIWPVIIVALFQIVDGYQNVAGGVIRGCGKQKFGAIINVISYQVISLPLAFVIAFVVKWYTAGFWVGLGVGVCIQAFGNTLVLLCMDWKKSAQTAMENAGLESDNFSGKKRSVKLSPKRDPLVYKTVPTDQSNSGSEEGGTRQPSGLSSQEFSSQDEMDGGGLLEKPELKLVESDSSTQWRSIPKKDLYFMLASKSLMLILCFLILMFGIILKEFHFSVPFYNFTQTTNSSYCPYSLD